MLQKLKSFLANDQLFYGVLLILIAVASFGLGRLSVTSQKSSEKPLISKEILTPAATIEAVSPATTSKATVDPSSPPTRPHQSGVVVGSKTGTKYHLPDCPGAKRIKPANLITFESVEAAKAAGYTPASNCPGLQ
jgi:Metal binding domain of Ada